MFWRKKETNIFIFNIKENDKKTKSINGRNGKITAKKLKRMLINESFHLDYKDWKNKNHPSNTIFSIKKYLRMDFSTKKDSMGWTITRIK